MPETAAAVADAVPIAEYLRNLDAILAAHDRVAQDRIGPAIASGRASRDVVKRVALEHYCVAKWTAPDLAVLIANAPDVHRFTMDDSTHYRHWAQRFAGETGYLSDPSRVRTAVDWCRGLGLDDDDVRAYTPLPETIAHVCTVLFYVRRTYEEGVAVVGWAGERIGMGRASDEVLREGLRAHYGVPLPPSDRVAADDGAADLFRALATSGTVQERCLAAVRNVASTAACRVRAMSRWVE